MNFEQRGIPIFTNFDTIFVKPPHFNHLKTHGSNADETLFLIPSVLHNYTHREKKLVLLY